VRTCPALSKGRPLQGGGVEKMWLNIIPHMAKAVQDAGGRFTHCTYEMSDNVRLGTAENIPCDGLRAVATLPGEHKVFFSSYYQGSPDACFVHMVPHASSTLNTNHCP
jgi:hypothetical protein